MKKVALVAGTFTPTVLRATAPRERGVAGLVELEAAPEDVAGTSPDELEAAPEDTIACEPDSSSSRSWRALASRQVLHKSPFEDSPGRGGSRGPIAMSPPQRVQALAGGGNPSSFRRVPPEANWDPNYRAGEMHGKYCIPSKGYASLALDLCIFVDEKLHIEYTCKHKGRESRGVVRQVQQHTPPPMASSMDPPHAAQYGDILPSESR